MPDVDVLIPVREPAPWLPQTLAAVRDMTGVSFSLVVVVHGPDASTSRAIEESGLPARVLASPASASLAETLNTGIEACTAPLIARLDADDIPLPYRLARQCEVLARHPEAAMTCSGRIFIDESGRETGSEWAPTSSDALLRVMRWKNIVWHPTVMFRREVVMALGGYSARATFVEDYELWLRMLASHSIIPIDEPLLRYRIHAHQVTQAKAIPVEASKAVLKARIALARARGESVAAARMRHQAWDARQWPRRLLR